MKPTKFDEAYDKIGGEFTGCLLIVPLMILGFLLALKLIRMWDLPGLLGVGLFALVIIGPQILVAQLNERAEMLSRRQSNGRNKP